MNIDKCEYHLRIAYSALLNAVNNLNDDNITEVKHSLLTVKNRLEYLEIALSKSNNPCI